MTQAAGWERPAGSGRRKLGLGEKTFPCSPHALPTPGSSVSQHLSRSSSTQNRGARSLDSTSSGESDGGSPPPQPPPPPAADAAKVASGSGISENFLQTLMRDEAEPLNEGLTEELAARAVRMLQEQQQQLLLQGTI